MSLLEQLRSKIKDVSDVNLAFKKSRPSFIFSEREAADIDLDTIYNLGHTGFDELVQLDTTLRSFENDFFSTSCKSIDRVQLTKSENKALNQKLGRLLEHLAPHFLISPTGRVLEWLIRRFRIQDFNAEQILLAFIPYYGTSQFMRLCKLIDFKVHHRSLWSFLAPYQHENITMSPKALAEIFKKNRDLLGYVHKSLLRADSAGIRYRTQTNFYLSLLLNLLMATPTLNEQQVHIYLPYVFELGMNSSEDLVLVGFMLLSQLMSRTELSSEAFTKVTEVVAHAHCSPEHKVICLMHVFQMATAEQQRQPLSPRAASRLCQLPKLDKLLHRLGEEYNAKPFLRPYVLYLASNSGTDAQNAAVLEKFLATFLDEPKILAELARVFLEACVTSQHPDKGKDQQLGAAKNKLSPEDAQGVISWLSQNCPDQLDAEIQKILQTFPSRSQMAPEAELTQTLFSFVQGSVATLKHHHVEDSTSVYLALNHPMANLRLMSLKKMVDSTEAQDTEANLAMLEDSLLDRLGDNNEEMLKYVLGVPRLAHVNDSTRLVDGLRVIMKRVNRLNQETSQALFAFILEQLPLHKPDLTPTVLQLVFPCLFIAQGSFQTAGCALEALGKSSLREHPLLHGTTALLSGLTDNEKSTLTAYNTQLIQTLSKNLATLLVGEQANMAMEFYQTQAQSPSMEPFVYMTLTAAMLAMLTTSSTNDRCYLTHTQVLGQLNRAIYQLRKSGTSDELAKQTVESNPNKGADFSFLDKWTCGTTGKKQELALATYVDCLLKLLRSLNRPNAYVPYTWFELFTTNPEAELTLPQAYQRGLLQVTAVMLGGAMRPALLSTVVSVLFEQHLKEEWLSFLASIWCQEGYAPHVRSNALQLATAYLQGLLASQGTVMDFQLLLPSLLLVLADSQESVRSAAVACLDALAPTVQGQYCLATVKLTPEQLSQHIYAVGSFYGPETVNVQYMLPNTTCLLVKHLLGNREEFLLDSRSVQRSLQTCLDKQSPFYQEQVDTLQPTFLSLMSYLPVWVNPRLQQRYLQLFGLVHPDCKPRVVQPILEDAMRALSEDPKGLSRLSLVLEAIRIFVRILISQEASKKGRDWDILLQLLDPTILANGAPTMTNVTVSQRQAIHLTTLGLLTPTFFQRLKANRYHALIGQIFVLAQQSDLEVNQAIRTLLRTVDIPAEFLQYELVSIAQQLASPEGPSDETEPTMQNQPNKRSTAPSSSNKKQNTKDSNLSSSQATLEATLQYLVFLLELVELRPQSPEGVCLVAPLFTTLANVMELQQRPSLTSLEYAKQLILSVLYHVFTKIAGSLADNGDHQVPEVPLEADLIRVDLLVQCMRFTSNSQTVRHLLQVLGSLAVLFPDKVLHNVMPIFTFMGVSVLQQDDEYTFQVIQLTLEKIMRAMLKLHEMDALHNLSEAARSDLSLTQQIPPTMTPILYIFIDALYHIPKHRRLPFYTALTRTLGAPLCLPTLWSFTLERHTDRWLRAHHQLVDPDNIIEFCVELGDQFPLDIELGSLTTLLRNLMLVPTHLPNQREAQGAFLAQWQPRCLVDLSKASVTSKFLRQYYHAVLQLVQDVLQSGGLIGKFATLGTSKAAVMEQAERLLTEFMETMLRVVEHLSQVIRDTHQDGSSSGQLRHHWIEVMDTAHGVLQNVERLLSLDAFIKMSTGLLNHTNREIRYQGLQMLVQKLQSLPTILRSLTDENRQSLVGLLPLLSQLITQESTAGVEGVAQDSTVDPALVLQLAVASVTHLATFFAADTPKPFISMVPVITGPHALMNSNTQVSTSSVLCLIFLCRGLGPRILDHVSPLVNKTVDMISQALKSGAVSAASMSRDRLNIMIAGIRLLEELVLKLPQFIVAFVDPILDLLFHPLLCESLPESTFSPTLAEMQGDDDDVMMDDSETTQAPKEHAYLIRHVKSLLQAMLTELKQSTVLVALFKQYDEIMNHQPAHVVTAYLDTVSTFIKEARLDNFQELYAPAVKFFLQALEFRRTVVPNATAQALTPLQARYLTSHNQNPLQLVDHVEQLVIHALTYFSAKLNEAMFKPMFLKLVDWVAQSDEEVDRPLLLIPFLRLVEQLLVRLKSIVTPYYSYVLPFTLQVLEQRFILNPIRVDPETDEFSTKGLERLDFVFCALSDHLWRQAMQSLTAVLLHDTTSDYCSRALFPQLLKAITGQIIRLAAVYPITRPPTLATEAGVVDQFPFLGKAYRQRVREVFIPCLVQLSVRYKEESDWKQLNHQILLLTHHDSSSVRIATLFVVQSLYQCHQEDFLVLLPESIPYFSELLEDENSAVERVCQKTLHVIEEYLGEPIQKYLE
ncbi:snoRNA-binding rRNA-processing protein utp10 [Dispira simplex]|nr:snoRNA-binding rRNA-processing protein utp10 [Dispira simplex]